MDKMSIYTVFQRIACVPVHNSNDAVIFYDELQKFTHSIIYAMGHPCVQSEDILRIVKQLDTIKSCLIDMERKLPLFRVEQQKQEEKVVASLTKKLYVYYPGVAANAQRDLDKLRMDNEKDAMEAHYDLQHTLQQGEHTAELIRITTEQLQMGQEDYNHDPTESIRIAKQHAMSQEDNNHDPTESIRIAEQHAMSQEDNNHDPTESIRIAEQHAMSQEDYNVITLLKEQRKHLKKQRHLSKKSMTISQEPEPKEPEPKEPQPQEPKVKSRKKPKKKSIDPDLELLEKECIRVATEKHIKSSNEKHVKSPAVKTTYEELLYKCGVDVNDDMFDDGTLDQFQEDYEFCRNKIGESTYTNTFHSELGITGFKPGMIINRIMQASEVGPADDMKDTMVLALLVEIDHMVMSQTAEQFNFIKMFIRSITVKKYLQAYINKDLSKKQQVLSLEWYQEWCKKHMNPKVLVILINLIHEQLKKYYTTTERLMKAYITHPST